MTSVLPRTANIFLRDQQKKKAKNRKQSRSGSLSIANVRDAKLFVFVSIAIDEKMNARLINQYGPTRKCFLRMLAEKPFTLCIAFSTFNWYAHGRNFRHQSLTFPSVRSKHPRELPRARSMRSNDWFVQRNFTGEVLSILMADRFAPSNFNTTLIFFFGQTDRKLDRIKWRHYRFLRVS